MKSEKPNIGAIGLFENFRAENFDLYTGICEWIDNSWDANAGVVIIEIGKNELTIIDDGEGVKDLGTMVRFYQSTKKGDPDGKHVLGRFGQGGRKAAIQLADKMFVCTVHKGRRKKLFADWFAVAKNDDGPLINYDESGIPTDEQSNTEITYKELARKLPDRNKCEEYAKRLGYTYMPALGRGKKITIICNKTSIAVKQFDTPPLEDILEFHVSIGRKTARIRIGIVPAHIRENNKPGITYVYGFRVVKEATGAGFKNRNYARLTGVCELIDGDDKWGLSPDKTSIQDKDFDALTGLIAGRIQALLAKAEKQANELHDSELVNRLNAMHRKNTGKSDVSKITRGPRTAKPKLPPQLAFLNRTESPRNDGKKPVADLNFSVENLGPDSNAVRVDTEAGRVFLNLEHPYVASQSAAKADDALYILGMSSAQMTHFTSSEECIKAVSDNCREVAELAKRRRVK